MSGPISPEQNLVISNLKNIGILRRFNPEEEMSGVTKNGGVGIMCSDGDIDAELFHRRISHRPHAVKIFGGPLLLAPNFGGYDSSFAEKIIENIKQGMEVKQTRTVFFYFHAPCGVATKFNYDIPQILELAKDSRDVLAGDKFFSRIFTLFHVKRVNKGGELEQNVYAL